MKEFEELQEFKNGGIPLPHHSNTPLLHQSARPDAAYRRKEARDGVR
jgi:hypothetical protein